MVDVKSALMLVWALAECFLFSGLMYGWNSLVFVLKEDGIYANLCDNSTHANDTSESLPMNISSGLGADNWTYAYDTLKSPDTNISRGLGADDSSQANATLESPHLNVSSRPFLALHASIRGSGPNNERLVSRQCCPGLVIAGAPRLGCPAQDQMMTLIFTVAFLVACGSSVVLGHVSYVFGTRVSRLLASLCFASGIVLLALVTPNTPWLLFPASALIGAGGLQVMVTNVQISVLFGRGASTVTGLLQGTFDASAVGLQLFKIVHENGVTLQLYSMVILALHALVLVSTLCWMPRTFLGPPSSSSASTSIPTPTSTPTSTSSSLAISNSATNSASTSPIVSAAASRPASTSTITSNHASSSNLSDIQTEDDDETRPFFRASTCDRKLPGILKDSPSLRSCLLSPIFLLHVLWMAVLCLRFSFFVASLNAFLVQVTQGDLDQVSHFTSVLQYALLCGLVTSVGPGVVYDAIRKRYSDSPKPARRKLLPAVVPLGTTTVLGLAMSASMLTSHPAVLYLTFTLTVLFRSFMFGVHVAFLSIVFPMNYFGVLYGVVSIVIGITTLLSNPLLVWASAAGFFQVQVFLLALNLLSLAHPAYVWHCCRKAESPR